MAKRWTDYYAKVVARYDVRVEGDDDPCELAPGPLHTYHHPHGAGFTGQFGATYLWTQKGRPAIFASFWSYQTNSIHRRVIVHEFHSLSERPLIASNDGALFLKPSEAGVEFKTIPNAPAPAEARGLRLSQMRTLAREFTGIQTFEKDTLLRQTQRPAYRYPEDVSTSYPDLQDGAVSSPHD